MWLQLSELCARARKVVTPVDRTGLPYAFCVGSIKVKHE